MKNLLFLLAAVCVAFSSYGQKTKRMKVLSSDNEVKKMYRVLKSDMQTLHGEYICIHRGMIVSRGEYDRGKRIGPWHFGSQAGNVRIEANFIDGKLDGRYRFLDSGKALCEEYYDTGKLDSLFTYSKSGALLSELRVDDEGSGMEKRYYSNGSLMQEIPIKNFMVNGHVRSFYPSGQLLQESIYKDDSPVTVLKTFNKEGGKMDGGTLAEGNGEFISYSLNEDSEPIPSEKVTYKNGVKEGKYLAFNNDGGIYSEGQFKDDERVGEWTIYSEEGPKTTKFDESEDSVETDDGPDKSRNQYIRRIDYAIVEEMPEFPGGERGLMNFLGKNINYPNDAKRQGAQGKVMASFVINEYGEVEDAGILESVHPSLDAEVLRVVRLLPNWKPGRQDGKSVKVQYNLPVRMRLN
jgi:TonB family protein